jgi:hypothetical protein
MADVYSRNEIAANNSTSASPVFTTTFGANQLKHRINQADVGRELIVKVALTNMTDANVTSIRNAITLAGGVAGSLPSNTGDAFTVAAIGTADGSAFESGVTDIIFMRVQGTGTFDTTDAAAGTGATVTVEATFAPAL